MTPFHLRDRFGKLARKLVGDPVASDFTPVAVRPQPTPVVAKPPPPITAPPVVPVAAPAAAPVVAAPEPPPPSPVEPAAEAGKSAADLAKQAKHWQRTRKGMLKWLADQGGQASMADMHTKSEAKYFVAHRGFSRLMEEYTEEGLVTYTSSTGLVVLTDEGRAAL